MSDRDEQMGRLADRAQRKDSDAKPDEEAEEDEDDTQAQTVEEVDQGLTETLTRNVKDRPSVFMYIPEAHSNELDLAAQSINMTYQRETGDALGKNRYLYPMVVKVGFDSAPNLSFEEIHELKDEIDSIDAEETA